jgi:hypothetical protein
MRIYETSVSGAPLEELRKKHGADPQLHVFSGAGVCGVGCVWHDIGGAELKNMERSSPKHALNLKIYHAVDDL